LNSPFLWNFTESNTPKSSDSFQARNFEYTKGVHCRFLYTYIFSQNYGLLKLWSILAWNFAYSNIFYPPKCLTVCWAWVILLFFLWARFSISSHICICSVLLVPFSVFNLEAVWFLFYRIYARISMMCILYLGFSFHSIVKIVIYISYRHGKCNCKTITVGTYNSGD